MSHSTTTVAAAPIPSSSSSPSSSLPFQMMSTTTTNLHSVTPVILDNPGQGEGRDRGTSTRTGTSTVHIRRSEGADEQPNEIIMDNERQAITVKRSESVPSGYYGNMNPLPVSPALQSEEGSSEPKKRQDVTDQTDLKRYIPGGPGSGAQYDKTLPFGR
ncbi:hypothetical protein BGZ65_007127 [Modicella reniformis]|uniref:Uncharacterized protein n=1 Tax=Modicella reniformis TaxID=1440133 RepID=A0A9P6IPE4_9FUNG|nr:hypothetical protein BGZ65_007127 [Modicella reniformis]